MGSLPAEIGKVTGLAGEAGPGDAVTVGASPGAPPESPPLQAVRKAGPPSAASPAPARKCRRLVPELARPELPGGIGLLSVRDTAGTLSVAAQLIPHQNATLT